VKRTASGHFETTLFAEEAVRAFVPAPMPPRPPIDFSGLHRPLEQATIALGSLGVGGDPDLAVIGHHLALPPVHLHHPGQSPLAVLGQLPPSLIGAQGLQRRHLFGTSSMSRLQVAGLLPMLGKITIVLAPQCRMNNNRPSLIGMQT